MTKFADLHIHTYYSDGTLSPEDIIREAQDSDLSCIGITDHDTIDGIQPTKEVAKDVGVEVIPGIELSSEVNGRDIHMLGYFIDSDNKVLQKKLLKMQEVRISRIKKMIKKLKELGVSTIEPGEILEKSPSKSIGRPHLAALLVRKRYVSSVKEAFDRYLAEGRPAYVKKLKISPYDAISLIEQSGGLAVLAHPVISNIDELIPSLVKGGLRGIEVFCPNCSKSAIQYYEGIAKKHGLLATGGSDAHGGTKSNTFIGKVKIPYSFVKQLKESAGR